MFIAILQVCGSVAAAASEHQQMPNGALMNGTASHDHDLSTEALIQALKPLLDPMADAEVPAHVEEAALDAVGRLGASPVASSLFFADPIELHRDVAVLALGRAGGPPLPLHSCPMHVTRAMHERCGIVVTYYRSLASLDTCPGCRTHESLNMSSGFLEDAGMYAAAAGCRLAHGSSSRPSCGCGSRLQIPQWRAGSSERRIAALHALARVSSPHGSQGAQGLPAHAEACFRDAVFSASAAPAGSLLGFLRQPFPDMQRAAFRWTRPVGLSPSLILPNVQHCACIHNVMLQAPHQSLREGLLSGPSVDSRALAWR